VGEAHCQERGSPPRGKSGEREGVEKRGQIILARREGDLGLEKKRIGLVLRKGKEGKESLGFLVKDSRGSRGGKKVLRTRERRASSSGRNKIVLRGGKGPGGVGGRGDIQARRRGRRSRETDDPQRCTKDSAEVEKSAPVEKTKGRGIAEGGGSDWERELLSEGANTLGREIFKQKCECLGK